MSGCTHNCQCAAGKTYSIKTVISMEALCVHLKCFGSNLLLELLVLAHFESQEVATLPAAKPLANVLVNILEMFVLREAILKATLKMLISISRLLMKMKRSMNLGTWITMRMKSWTKLVNLS